MREGALWKEAFELYTNRTGSTSSELMTKVLALKNEMNRARNNFNMPADHTIRITDNWLLGFVEGEGSFYVKRNRLILGFAISQAKIDKAVMIEIQKFLLTLASISNLANPNERKLVYLYDWESRNNRNRGVCLIKVENEEFVLKVLIPRPVGPPD